MLAIDSTQGTPEPILKSFEGKRTALVLTFFVDAEKALVEGYQTAAQGAARGVLQDAGFNVSDARYAATLTAPEGKEAFVKFAVNVATVEEEAETAVG